MEVEDLGVLRVDDLSQMAGHLFLAECVDVHGFVDVGLLDTEILFLGGSVPQDICRSAHVQRLHRLLELNLLAVVTRLALTDEPVGLAETVGVQVHLRPPAVWS